LCVAFAYTHSDGNGNANSDSDGNGVSISNANDYANCNTWRQNYPHTTAASHAGAAPDSITVTGTISSGTREAIRESPEKAVSSLSESSSKR
jgi:hypothetical protein